MVDVVFSIPGSLCISKGFFQCLRIVSVTIVVNIFLVRVNWMILKIVLLWPFFTCNNATANFVYTFEYSTFSFELKNACVTEECENVCRP